MEKQGKLPATVYDLQEDEINVVKPPPKRSTKRAVTAGALVGVAVLAIVHYALSTRTHGSYSWFGSPQCTHSRSWAAGDSFVSKPNAEAVFLAVPNNESAIAASRFYATSPHLAGSEQDLVTARQFLELFQRELGIKPPRVEPIFDAGSRESQHAIRSLTAKHHRQHRPNAWVDTYYPIMNTGVKQQLQILGKDGNPVWEANLEEIADMSDPDAGRHRTDIPTWHGLSKGGDVSGPLVYVEYGRKEDFDELVHAGVKLKGTIAIARYGALFRGLKIKAAQEAGCVGVLIYSDPIDDGYVTAKNGFKEWPYGPARNSNSVQRGSVQFISKYPGDPTTPGYPSYKNATRLEAVNKPSIPSIPISWNNAKKLLEQIGHGKYKSESHIRLHNEVNDKVVPIWNVMAVIPGTQTSHKGHDEVVIVGNHRDAWVMGAADPTSGTVSLHEVVRGLGALLRRGWKPRRTIVIASWDAEEYGLIGSTEWGEDFADWIQEHAVAYLNLDVAVSGSRYNVHGSPSLAHLIRDTAEAVLHPTLANKTLWDARLDEGPFKNEGMHNDGSSVVVMERMREEARVIAEDLPVSPLGSGSDYTVMLQRLGVASTDMGFGYTLSDPAYHYHSIYDSQLWQETYADPGFHRHVAVAKHLGLMTLRLADSPLLPINTTHYTLEMFKWLDGVAAAAKLTGVSVDLDPVETALDQLLRASLALDHKKKLTLQHLQRSRPLHARLHLGILNGLTSFISHLFGRTSVPDRLESPAHASGMPQVRPSLIAINTKLASFERGFLSDAGIKDREWYRHLGVAPGKWKGYGATPFPALSEAIEIDKDADLAEVEVARLVGVLGKLRDTVGA